MSQTGGENKTYWRSLEEKNSDSNFLEELYTEFPLGVPPGIDPSSKVALDVDRRDFLKMMGFGLAGVMMSCSNMPVEKAIPYLVQPEDIVPGKAYWYASTCTGCTANCGILIKNREGRPIKLEGNPQSPINRGGLCSVGQSQVLSLYDSGRLHGPIQNGSPVTWKVLDGTVLAEMERLRSHSGKIVFLTSTLNSPSTLSMIDDIKTRWPNVQHVTYDSVSSSGLVEAHDKVFGMKAIPQLRFDLADVIVSFDADFLGTWLSPVEFAKQFSKGRNLTVNPDRFSHLIQIESRLSLTGSNADLRHSAKPSEMSALVARLLWHIESASGNSTLTWFGNDVDAALDAHLSDAAQKLLRHKQKSLVISGSNDLDEQILVARINHLLGNYGKTLLLDRHSKQKSGVDADFTKLVTEMESGLIRAVFIYGCNPTYDSPISDRFSKALEKIDLTVSLASYADETAQHVKFIAPDNHFLESWNDYEPYRGLYQLSQPAIRSVYNTRQAGDSLLSWFGLPKSFKDYVREYWKNKIFSEQSSIFLFDDFWKKSLHDGFFVSQSVPQVQYEFHGDTLASWQAVLSRPKTKGFELSFYEKISMRDGRHANNPWLQEVPDPISKATWDNYINMSIVDAKKMGIEQGDVVRLTVDRQSLSLPVLLQPGQMSGCVSVALGYGRRHSGKVGDGVGKNAFELLVQTDNRRIYHRGSVNLEKTGSTHNLALTQTHYSLEGRPIFKETTLDKFKKDPSSGNKDRPELVMLWEQHQDKNHSWGMAIDTSMCTGCSGCLVGCQSENNVPVVGKEEVFLRREMHWIRIDRYYKGNEENPDVAFQPMMCQHCANAPCESVCPVLATVHSSDGLNQQVYNRCVGTRYCANNCPYKVRRFNWFDYANNKKFNFYMNDNTGRLVLNPDIVVRSRGVMEKCSMCVQRIQEEKLLAKKEGRKLNSDDIKLACQQSCPSDAIVFGDMNDPKSRLSKLLVSNKRRYHVLGEINVKPHVNYLTKVRNRT